MSKDSWKPAPLEDKLLEKKKRTDKLRTASSASRLEQWLRTPKGEMTHCKSLKDYAVYCKVRSHKSAGFDNCETPRQASRVKTAASAVRKSNPECIQDENDYVTSFSYNTLGFAKA